MTQWQYSQDFKCGLWNGTRKVLQCEKEQITQTTKMTLKLAHSAL